MEKEKKKIIKCCYVILLDSFKHSKSLYKMIMKAQPDYMRNQLEETYEDTLDLIEKLHYSIKNIREIDNQSDLETEIKTINNYMSNRVQYMKKSQLKKYQNVLFLDDFIRK